MEKVIKSPAKFSKWDKLIVDLDNIPDGLEPNKMKTLLPSLDVKRKSETFNNVSEILRIKKDGFLEDFEEPAIMNPEIFPLNSDSIYHKYVDTEMKLPENQLNGNERRESDVEDINEKEKLSLSDDIPRMKTLSPVNSVQISSNHSNISNHCLSSDPDNLSLEASRPTVGIIVEDTPMSYCQPVDNSDPATSNWLERFKKKSRSGASHKRTATDDSDNPNSQSQSVSNTSRAKRGKYPWEMAKETGSCKSTFKTAAAQLMIDNQKKYGRHANNNSSRTSTGKSYGSTAEKSSHCMPMDSSYGGHKRSLGARRGVGSKFVPPVVRDNDEAYDSGRITAADSTESTSPYASLMTDDRLKNVEAKMVELIMNEILEKGPPVEWDDIAGLQTAKTTIQEIVVWPMLRPDIFSGLRGPPKGILLFGPPGTGKTLIGKCIASQSESTFFSISASSLTSKWIGEGEKMVRALFAVAKCHQPAVIFMDEIDALLSQRSNSEHESSRRMKTEFLVQLDGATCGNDERILVVGATNRPQELDEAARRRLVKRLYIPLPDKGAREHIIRNLLRGHSNSLEDTDVSDICSQTDGYSGADMANLCREAALGPIRSIGLAQIKHISVDEVRPISAEDFQKALTCIRASVSETDLLMYEDWNNKFGIVRNLSLSSS